MKNYYRIFVITSVFLIQFSIGAFGQWQKTNGPFCGNIRCFSSDGTNILTGTERGGVYLSKDNGGSWTEINSGITNLNIRLVAIRDSLLFAGVSFPFFRPIQN